MFVSNYRHFYETSASIGNVKATLRCLKTFVHIFQSAPHYPNAVFMTP